MKDTLVSLETVITDIMESDPFHFFQQNTEIGRLKRLLEERQRILNEMFIPSPENIQRFIQVNQHLYTLTQKLYRRVNQMLIQQPLVNNPDFDDDYEVGGRLTIPFNGKASILSLPDDGYYGSNFALMINCLSEIYSEPALHATPGNNSLDDGASWDEGPFQDYLEFKNITICYAVHDICTHRPYSIPDLLRLNDFWCEVELTSQSITTQDGTRQ